MSEKKSRRILVTSAHAASEVAAAIPLSERDTTIVRMHPQTVLWVRQEEEEAGEQRQHEHLRRVMDGQEDLNESFLLGHPMPANQPASKLVLDYSLPHGEVVIESGA